MLSAAHFINVCSFHVVRLLYVSEMKSRSRRVNTDALSYQADCLLWLSPRGTGIDRETRDGRRETGGREEGQETVDEKGDVKHEMKETRRKTAELGREMRDER